MLRGTRARVTSPIVIYKTNGVGSNSALKNCDMMVGVKVDLHSKNNTKATNLEGKKSP